MTKKQERVYKDLLSKGVPDDVAKKQATTTTPQKKPSFPLPTMRTPGTGGQNYREILAGRDPRPENSVDAQNERFADIDAERDKQHEETVEQAKEGLEGVNGALTESNGYGKNEKDSEKDSEKETDIYNTITGDGGDSGTEDKKSKRAYYIWDAYNKRLLDEAGRNYYTIDAISNFLSNTGKRIGNVGAQFTGGTVDNDYTDSEWNKKMKALNVEETQIDAERMGGPQARKAIAEVLANEGSAIANNNGRLTVNAKNKIIAIANKLDDKNPVKYQLIAAAVNGDFGGVNALLAAGTNWVSDKGKK